jgi:hypothetical protein
VREDVMKRQAFCFLVILPLATFLVVHTIRNDGEALAQGGTLIVTPTVEISTTPTSSATVPVGDASQVYRVAEEAIKASERTLELVKWLIGAVVAAIGGATALGVLLVRRAGAAEDRSREANAMASLAQKLVEKAEERAAKAEETVNALTLKASELDYGIRSAQDSIQMAVEAASVTKETAREARAQIDDVSIRLADLQRQTEELRGTLGIFDESALRFLATLRLIDRWRRTLLISDDPKRREQAEWALLEKTHADSPLVRRESVAALSGIGEPSEAIVERFEEIVAEEDDPEVRVLAEDALKRRRYPDDEE